MAGSRKGKLTTTSQSFEADPRGFEADPRDFKLPILKLGQSIMSLRAFYTLNAEGELLLDPPYQRGDVWGNKRRVNLMKSIIMGVPIPSIILNDRCEARWPLYDQGTMYAVIDGRQRLTTVLMFFKNKLPIPGAWLGLPQTDSFYADMPEPIQRFMKNCTLAVSQCRLSTLEEEQQVFDLVNFGGLAQGEEDLED